MKVFKSKNNEKIRRQANKEPPANSFYKFLESNLSLMFCGKMIALGMAKFVESYLDHKSHRQKSGQQEKIYYIAIRPIMDGNDRSG